MNAIRVLAVDDEPTIRFAVTDFLTAAGHRVTAVASCAEAIAATTSTEFDVAILDHRLPDGTGLELMHGLRARSPDLAVVLLTGLADLDLATRALREGADHFLAKPVDLSTIDVLLLRTVLARQRARVAASHASRITAPPPFACADGPARTIAADAQRAAAAACPVIILGETGSGKGVLARWMHDHGPRAAEPMIDLNCAGLSRDLLEAELFGHEKGAFTGAVADRPGLLELAHRGTLFLDEVAEIDPVVQAKLLKAIEEQTFRRVGSGRDRRVSVRIIAATSADLEAMVADGRFRKDLYYRLATVVMTVPPLRTRRSEIPELAATILARLTPPHHLARLTPAAIASLQEYPWPGNVRELRNVLERALLFANGLVLDEPALRPHLAVLRAPAAAAPVTAASAPARLTLAELERQHIVDVMREVGGRVDEAAAWLAVPRSTLYEKLRRYGIPRRP